MIKGIIFDMDGVLVDAKDWHYHALNSALALFGYNISHREHLTTYDGLPTREKLRMMSDLDNFPIHLHEIVNKLKQKYTIDYVNRFCSPSFVHQFTLSRLVVDGYNLALASNSIASTIESMMSKSNLMRFLDFYLSADHVSEAKPSPEIYNLAISKLGLVPEECLILEDNVNGILAARASGAHVMEISEVHDVNYSAIKLRIHEIESSL